MFFTDRQMPLQLPQGTDLEGNRFIILGNSYKIIIMAAVKMEKSKMNIIIIKHMYIFS